MHPGILAIAVSHFRRGVVAVLAVAPSPTQQLHIQRLFIAYTFVQYWFINAVMYTQLSLWTQKHVRRLLKCIEFQTVRAFSVIFGHFRSFRSFSVIFGKLKR
eukprot:COSAG02_NODE_38876_length_423_cov_9.669753_1_plen_101_part_10